MLDGVGPGAYADRADVADMTFDGAAAASCRCARRRASRVAPATPTRAACRCSVPTAWSAAPCVDLWVDRSEMLFRYLEVEVPARSGTRRVLLPVNFSRIGDARRSRCSRSSARSSRRCPAPAQPEQVTLARRREDHGLLRRRHAVRHAAASGAAAVTRDQAHEHEFEAAHGPARAAAARRAPALAGLARLARAGARRDARAQAGGLLRGPAAWRVASALLANGGRARQRAVSVLWLLPAGRSTALARADAAGLADERAPASTRSPTSAW